MVPEKLFHDFMIEIEGELFLGMEGGIDHSGKSHCSIAALVHVHAYAPSYSLSYFLISSSF